MIHCGSRGLGHQVASDYIEIMENKFGTKGLPDRELINAPVRSPLVGSTTARCVRRSTTLSPTVR